MTDVMVMTVDAVEPHPNADRLEIAVMRGYRSVCSKGSMHPGDTVVYVCPDAQIDLEQPWAADVAKYLSRTGRVKTIKLRGEFSEGLVVDPEALKSHGIDILAVPEDKVAETLGITHYEPPLPTGDMGNMKAIGHLPYGLGKTDQENVQAFTPDRVLGRRYLVTRKKDGSSCTVVVGLVARNTWGIHVTSRSLDLDMECDNIYTRATKAVIPEVQATLATLALAAQRAGKALKLNTLVLRGEVTGAGIQRKKVNKDAVGDPVFSCFEAFGINSEHPHERLYCNLDLRGNRITICPKVQTVPFIEVIESLAREDVDRYINAPASDGEGVVLWEVSSGSPVVQPTGFSFKIKSRDYDAKMSGEEDKA